jgi:hypothetical protein
MVIIKRMIKRKKLVVEILAVIFWVCALGVAYSQKPTILMPGSKNDYGSGSSYHTDWYYPGGLDGEKGYFVGHPNLLPRADRSLVGFNIFSYLLPPFETVNFKKVLLHFSIMSIHGKEKSRVLEVTHLQYDARVFSGNDLINDNKDVVGTVTVGPSTSADKNFSMDVTHFINDDIYKGNQYISFRFRDVTAEEKGNPDLAPAGVAFPCPTEGTLTLEIQER